MLASSRSEWETCCANADECNYAKSLKRICERVMGFKGLSRLLSSKYMGKEQLQSDFRCDRVQDGGYLRVISVEAADEPHWTETVLQGYARNDRYCRVRAKSQCREQFRSDTPRKRTRPARDDRQTDVRIQHSDAKKESPALP